MKIIKEREREENIEINTHKNIINYHYLIN